MGFFLAVCLIAETLNVRAVEKSMDFANPKYREAWFAHPVVGDPSYDSLARFEGNPIYAGSPPYEWPVNGSLFQDRATGWLYVYVSLYPKGYWPAGPAKLMRSRDRGRTWEDLGLVLQGDKDLFDGDGVKAGATCDATVVEDTEGYHTAYGWAKPDNSDGGIAYAFSKSPEGPFTRDPTPIHAESAQPLLPPGYKRVYASTLIRRKNDWMILASMSTPGNAGGMWAFIGMTAPAARGPYSPPIFLRAPQQGFWQPQPVEFFPAFVHEDFVYAPLTSVAANRSYQVIYRARIEEAHRPEAWSVWQSGSAFHAEGHAYEAFGIWGQAFSGLVDKNGLFRIMYPARNTEGVGTINVASRRWDRPYQRGFWVSGPNAPSLGLILRKYKTFRLECECVANGPWRLLWNFRGPLGPDRSAADATISPLTWRDMTTLSFNNGTWRLETIDSDGNKSTSVSGSYRVSSETFKVSLDQRECKAIVTINDEADLPLDVEASGGGIGIVAEKGTCIHVRRFRIDGLAEPGSWFLLPTEGIIGAGNREKEWMMGRDGFRYGAGYVAYRGVPSEPPHTSEGARSKWSFRGTEARVWSPRGPDFGEAEVFLDGESKGRVSLHAATLSASSVVWRSGPLEPGFHALMLVGASGRLPVDCLEFVP